MPNVRISAALHDQLKAESEKTGVPITKIIKRALLKMWEANNEKKDTH